MNNNTSVRTELVRDLNFWTALSIGVGTMIAAGIFTLSGLAIRNVGSGAIASFLLAGLVSLFTALAYCEFVSLYPHSGEGYLYARKTFSAPIAYLVGLALFLGYVSSCSFYIASLSSYFVEFILETPVESISGIIFLIGLTYLNIKGAKESGRFQLWVTVAKVLLLIWFIVGGFKYVSSSQLIDEFNNDIIKLVQTSAFVFITFFGFSAIAATAGEVKQPLKNVPKAIFWAMGIVTVLYILVVTVIIAASLTDYTEASMGVAAKKFLGGIGGMVIIAGALISMISASNASIMAGSRVALSMSQLGHLPKELGSINKRTHTPIMALFLVAGLILIFVTSLNLEDLAHFADTVLLMALSMVNLGLIVHRKKFPDIERPFKVPFVPIIPAIGILANLYLLSQLLHHVMPVSLALGSLIVGFLGFLSWKGVQPAAESIHGEPSKLAIEKHAMDESDKKDRILVPIANPKTMKTLIELGCHLARQKNAVLVILRVITVPPIMPLDYRFDQIEEEERFLNSAQSTASDQNVSVSSVLRIGYDAAKAILETAKDWNCQLVILGWKGFSSTKDKILGRTLDAVVTHAKSDIMLVKLAKDKRKLNNVLLPTAGGPHAKVAESIAAILVKALEGNLSLCRVISNAEETEGVIESHKQGITRSRDRILNSIGIEPRSVILRGESIVQTILEESSKYDTVIVGATRDSIYQQILFGSIPEQLAKSIQTNIIVVKHHSPVKALWGKVLSEPPNDI